MRNKSYWTVGMVGVLALLVLAVVAAGCTTQQGATTVTPSVAPSATKTVTDLAGRNVVLPYSVTKVITFNAVPPLNGYIMAMGKGNTIINGLPAFGQVPTYRYQTVFAPQLATEPVVQDSGNNPNIETIIGMSPDVVITTEMSTVQTMENKSIPAIYIGSGMTVNDSMASMNVLGQVYNDPARAQAYTDYCNELLAKVNSRVASVPESERPHVLYLWATSMSTWNKSGCIDPAGGIDTFDPSGMAGGSGGVTSRYTISMEQLLKWNPDVIIVRDATDIPYMNNKTEFSTINAVKNNRVYVTPVGTFTWGSVEYPLLVEWSAWKFFPDKFTKAEIVSDMKAFYKEFFDYSLTDQEADNMLCGMQNVPYPSAFPAAPH